MNGKGKYLWPDGRKYFGEFLEDNKHGNGEFYWPDGRKCNGKWLNGQ